MAQTKFHPTDLWPGAKPLGTLLRGGAQYPVLKDAPTPRQLIAAPPGKRVRVRVRNPTGAQGYKGTG